PEPAAEVSLKYLPGGIGAVAFDRAVTQRWSDPNAFVAFSTGSLVNLAQGKFGPHQPGDVRWLATLGIEYGVVAVRKGSRFGSLRALREQLARDPAAVVFGAGGSVGSQDWIKAALLVKAAGRDHRAMRFVSFEGGGQAVVALQGGHVDVFCGDAAEARDGLASGDLRLVAVLAPQRLGGALAGVPTAREQGVDIVWPTVRGIYMGPGVTDKAHADWARTLRRIMATPQFAQVLQAYGLQPYPLVGDEVAPYVREQVARMRELARELHLRVP
ncbi:MAG: tripartite tricarboxylate transporter substrate binding protein, partial [Comamonadaceae bacterium]